LDLDRRTPHRGGAGAHILELLQQGEEITGHGHNFAASETRDGRARTEGQDVAHRVDCRPKRPGFARGRGPDSTRMTAPIRRNPGVWCIFRGRCASETAEPIYISRATLTDAPPR